MAAATGLVFPTAPFIRRVHMAPLNSFSRSFLTEKNARRTALRCYAVACGGVDDLIVGATSSSKPRIPRAVGMGSKLVGCGSAVPKHIISNDDLAQIVDTSDEWISVRTGIRNRRILSGDETLNGLALEAANGALQMAGVMAHDVDLIIMCTSTPDDLFGGGGQVFCKSSKAYEPFF